jgi:hypothetical protein
MNGLNYEQYYNEVTKPAVEAALKLEKTKLIKKACDWLNNFYNEDTHSYLIKEDIDKFKKEMEEL